MSNPSKREWLKVWRQEGESAGFTKEELYFLPGSAEVENTSW